MIRPSRSFWVALFAFFSLFTAGTGYVYNFEINRQVCLQNFATAHETCHHPEPGEQARTIFFIKGSK